MFPLTHRHIHFILEPEAATTVVSNDLSRRFPPIKHANASHNQAMNSNFGCLPLQTLLPDLLCIIFRFCLPGAPPCTADHVTQPMRLSQVNRHWRYVAFSTKYLWSAFSIVFNPNPKITAKAIMTKRYLINSLFLQRSNRLPLDFKFHLDLWDLCDDDPSTPHEAMELMTSLLSQESRWRRVDLYYNGDEKSPKFPQFCILRMPQIESLELTMAGPITFGLGEFCDYGIRISASSSLEYLEIRGSFYIVIEDGISLPNLTRCHFRTFVKATVDICLKLLQAAPAIEEFSISINGDNVGCRLPIYISCPRLWSFAIFDESSVHTNLGLILESIHDAKLRDLYIRSHLQSISINTESCLRFSQHCSLELQSFRVPLRDLDSDTFVRLLRKSPNLQSLGLYAPSDDILRLLTLGGDGEDRFVKLEDIDIIGTVSAVLLEAMVLSRITKFDCCLKRVSLIDFREPMDIPETIRSYVENYDPVA